MIAALMITNVVLAWTFDDISKSAVGAFKATHKSIGITVLGLAILRLLWRLTHNPPPLPPYAAWERRSAHAAHWVLYGLVFALPLSGWTYDSAWKGAAAHPLKLFFVIPWFRFGFLAHLDPATKESWHALLGQVHTSFAYVLYAIFTIHVAGALKHQFLDRAPELQRMWPAQRRTNTQ
jgi:cytochrome b561